MIQVNIQLIDAVTEAVGVNNMLDAVLGRLDSDTIQQILCSIMKENGLGQ